MKVRLLTIEQKEQLIGKTYDDVQYFNPTLDSNDNWFISNEEINQCNVDAFQWVKYLTEIEYKPKNIDSII